MVASIRLLHFPIQITVWEYSLRWNHMQKFKFPSEVKLKSEIYFTRKTAYANSTLKSWQNKSVYLKGPCCIVMIYVTEFLPLLKSGGNGIKNINMLMFCISRRTMLKKVSQHLGRLDQETIRPVRTAVWSTWSHVTRTFTASRFFQNPLSQNKHFSSYKWHYVLLSCWRLMPLTSKQTYVRWKSDSTLQIKKAELWFTQREQNDRH